MMAPPSKANGGRAAWFVAVLAVVVNVGAVVWMAATVNTNVNHLAESSNLIRGTVEAIDERQRSLDRRVSYLEGSRSTTDNSETFNRED